MTDLNQLLDQLKTAREDAANARDTKRKLVEAVQATVEYRRADEATNTADDAITRLEAQIKTMTLSLHELCAELPERVGVKNFKVFEYNPTVARDWCFTNFRPALKLDEKTFDKAVKDGNIPAEIATVKMEARAQIATKL